MKVKYTFKKRPAKFQADALQKALLHGSYGIFFEQRVGKTRVAIDYCGVQHLAKKANIALIVCPLSVIYAWEEQIAQYFPYDCDIHFYPERIAQRDKLLESIKQRHTTNPSKMSFIIANYARLATYTKNKYVEIERLKRHLNIDVLILDESHLVKNHKSRRHKALYKLAMTIPYRLLLTGTPIAKHFYDIFGQFRIMNDSVFGHRWADFKENYCTMGGFKGKEITACKDPATLSKLMAKYSYRVLRKDVINEVDVEHVTIPLHFTPKEKALYDELKNKYIVELEKETVVKADFAITRLLRLHQFCGGFIPDDEGDYFQVSKTKLNATVDLLETLVNGGEHVVVFYKFRHEADELYSALYKKRFKIGRINGAVSAHVRRDAINDFQKGELDVILVQIATGCMGITLDAAHINIFYSMDFSLSNFNQAKDRVMGRGQKKPVTNYYMAIKGTVDTKIMRTLQKNQQIADLLVDNWQTFFS